MFVKHRTAMLGRAPEDGRWQSLYRFYYRFIRPVPALRALARGYFLPALIENWRRGAIYRVLGVAVYGRIVPTGGILVRRLTGAGMPTWTLAGVSPEAARQFFFRTCAMEGAHLLAFLAVSIVAGICWITGRTWLALGGMAANLVVNLYPMLLQRYNRVRIWSLLERRSHRRDGA